jgi:hypothetical protein
MFSTVLSVRSLFVVSIVTAAATRALAQTPVTNLETLRRQLIAGDSISLVQTNGEKVTGRLLRVGDADLDVRVVNRSNPRQERRPLDVTIPLNTIQSLERPRDSTRNGALLGASVGAGVGAGMFIYAAMIDANEMDEWAHIYLGVAALFTGIGGLVGWAIDASSSRPHVRYDAPSTKHMKVSVSPLLSRGRGATLTVSF